MCGRKYIRVCLFALVLAFLGISIAWADTGPKPSVVVEFQGLENEIFYVTLLADSDSTGPWSHSDTWDDWYGERYGSRNADAEDGRAVWEAFNSYADGDSFYFLGCFADCSHGEAFRWGYYPPETFKILLYFPEYSKLIVSDEVYEAYAFDSYFTADLSVLDPAVLSAGNDSAGAVEKSVSGNELAGVGEAQTTGKDPVNADKGQAAVFPSVGNGLTAGSEAMKVTRTYDFTWEVFSLLCRTVVTILVELCLAWVFGFRVRQQLRIIACTNIVTQTILNIVLNVVRFRRGRFLFLFSYIWLELLIFVIEGFLYQKFLRRSAADHIVSSESILHEKAHRPSGRMAGGASCGVIPRKKDHPWLYALTANAASFAAGLLLAILIPGVF